MRTTLALRKRVEPQRKCGVKSSCLTASSKSFRLPIRVAVVVSVVTSALNGQLE